MTAPWWTPADAAEQAVLVREIVDWDFAHRAGCVTCERDGYCRDRRCRIEALVEWHECRSARSFADELRAIEDVIDLPELLK